MITQKLTGKYARAIIYIFMIVFSVASVNAQQTTLTDIPDKPELFLPGIVSTPDTREFSCTLTPDGKEFYFARKKDNGDYSIFIIQKTADGWTSPQLASFSGPYFNHEPYISPDGKNIYWGSQRPKPDGTKGYAVWVADRVGEEWTNIRMLDFPAMYITSTTDGTLYYTARGPGGAAIGKAWKNAEGQWQTELLPEPVLADEWDGHPLIAPDESWLIFDSETREGNAECGLFFTKRNEDGSWTEPESMINSAGIGRFAMLSHDQRILFFSWKGDIYYVSAEIIRQHIK